MPKRQELAEVHEISDQDCRKLYEWLLCSGIFLVEKTQFEGGFDGAIALPKGFAENAETVIATAGLPRSILLLEEGHWVAITSVLLNRKKTGVQQGFSAAEALRSLFLGNAVELDISPQRTIELPNHLMDYAGIENR